MRNLYVLERIRAYFPELTAKHIFNFLRRSTFVSLEKRYMYFRIPKAACTAMAELLRTVENAPPIKLFVPEALETRRDMFINSRWNAPLPSLVDLDNWAQREVLESGDFLRMTVVRNPYTRLVSAWKNKILVCEPSIQPDYLAIKGSLPAFREKSLASFAEFLEYVRTKCDLTICDSHWRRQVDHTFFPAMDFTYVGKLEQFGEVLRRFERHLGLSEPLALHRKNESISFGSNPYTQELADKVYALYQQDFEVLGYDRNAWVGRPASEKSGVPLEKFIDEVVERNLIIASLYDQCDQLRAQLPGVSRLGVAHVIDSMAALHSISDRANRKIRRLARRALRPCRHVAIAMVSSPRPH